MLNVTFLPKKKTLAKPVSYLVDEVNATIAFYKAKQAFEREQKAQYYNVVNINKLRTL
jgi:hypothetical protein